MQLWRSISAGHRAPDPCQKPGWVLHGGSGIYPAWLKDIAEAGFVDLRTYSFDVDVPYSHESWRGRIRASAGVGATLDPGRVKRFDAELAMLLVTRHPVQPMAVPHRVWVLLASTPS